MSDISIIIVSYNSESFISKCISSVLKNAPGSEIIVIDNNSSDNTVKELEKFGSKIKLIKSSENLGFSKGNNKAAKEATKKYLFFLNPDTEMEKSVLEEMVQFYESTVDVGLIAPKLIQSDGKVQESVKRLPSVWGAFQEFILGVKNAYSQYAPASNKPIEVEMVYGAAMLIKKDLFESIQFDERYFMYYEDAELCKRVRESGKKIYYYPEVSIKHLVGASKSSQDKYKLNLESSKIYHGQFQAMLLNLIFRLHAVFS
jgi:GT2 family glycosyltransferase